MKKTTRNKLFFILCTVLIAAVALCTMGCTKETPAQDTQATATAQSGEPTVTAYSYTPAEEIGNGEKTLWLNVVHSDGSEKGFCIKTDKETVGDALVEVGLITADMTEYGMYIKTVDGETLDYDANKLYWAFFVDNEYAVKSVDKTEINQYITYYLKAQA